MSISAPPDLIVLRAEGLYCPAGDFHIDPWQPVPRAVITHGHGDHARIGMGDYHCTAVSISCNCCTHIRSPRCGFSAT